MGSKKVFVVLSAVFCLITQLAPVSFAQQGSVYLSVGDNKPWYSSSTIHIDQPELGNSYDLWKAKANNQTNASFSPLNLNYRLGYYFNEFQDLGLELNYDPVQYAVVNGSNITATGTINNQLHSQVTLHFNSGSGYFYYFEGLNLILVNFVKRWRVYRSNSSKISVDFLGRMGLGPVLPHFESKLAANPVINPNFDWGGWNYGLEAGFRFTLYRYGYVEFTGKYDYAVLQGMQVYDGTATQNIGTYEIIGSIGFTFPTTRMNPLFRKERKIITMLPWFQHKDELGEPAPEKSLSDTLAADSQKVQDLQDVLGPLDKDGARKAIDSMARLDSIAKIDTTKPDTTQLVKHNRRWRRQHKNDTLAAPDSAMQKLVDSSLMTQPKPDSVPQEKHGRRKKKKHRHDTEAADTSAVPQTTIQSAPAAPDSPPQAPPPPPADTSGSQPIAKPEEKKDGN